MAAFSHHTASFTCTRVFIVFSHLNALFDAITQISFLDIFFVWLKVKYFQLAPFSLNFICIPLRPMFYWMYLNGMRFYKTEAIWDVNPYALMFTVQTNSQTPTQKCNSFRARSLSLISDWAWNEFVHLFRIIAEADTFLSWGDLHKRLTIKIDFVQNSGISNIAWNGKSNILVSSVLI